MSIEPGWHPIAVHFPLALASLALVLVAVRAKGIRALPISYGDAMRMGTNVVGGYSSSRPR